MVIERNLASQKGKEYCELPSEPKNSKSKKSKRRQRKASPVQKLYEICKQVFATARPGIVPPAGDVERIRSVLDEMREVDFGLSPNMPFFKTTTTSAGAAAGRPPKITYIHLHLCDKFSIGIFCLPPSGIIPLHNHPGMTVFSKLLFGTMHIKSYDWAPDLTRSQVRQPPGGARLAKVKVDAKFTAPCRTSILYPADGGNMHCFTALTACAILDVMGPPYSDPDGRHCTYYLHSTLPAPSVVDNGGTVAGEDDSDTYAWLEETENPKYLDVDVVPYSCPTK
ncbi:plant cysteine oxidase 2-like [Diospyros lotus]|uniref:plant cysteine oxidase 2-like n=1 Tax=Diospyros lotus TaxID=55363 RepID=UPI002256D499|nr:plant cysteine oxidase 2-like [Diospyros lotus]